MNPQASSNLATTYARQLSRFFSADQLDGWARKTGFIVRSRKLTALGWLQMLLSEATHLYHYSLGQECGLLATQAQIYLKKQSLQERWTPTCIAFLREVITQLMEQQLVDRSAQLGGPFNRIIIGDSTSFELPACHQNTYKGYGGSSSPSALKIYYEYDLKAGLVMGMQDSHGTHADTRFNQAQQLEAGDLVLKDLGFFTYGFYQQVQAQGAFYIRRYRSKTRLFVDEQPITLASIVNQVSADDYFEFWAHLGTYAQLRQEVGPQRIILKRLPAAVVEQKRRRLHKQAQREGVTISDEQRLLCQYEVLITNVPVALLTATQVREYYRLRWQIELIFKTWKSLLGLHQVVSANLYRFQAQLLGSLLLVLLGSPLVSSLKTQHWQAHQTELSDWYLWRWLRDHAYELAAQLGRGMLSWQRWIRGLIAFATHNARKHKRKHKGVPTRPLPYEIITQMA